MEPTLKESPVVFTNATDNDPVESLRFRATVLPDEHFPDSLTTGDYMKQMEPWDCIGAGVKLSDSLTAIFWYRPVGSETYRVIYGSVRDIVAEDLPQ